MSEEPRAAGVLSTLVELCGLGLVLAGAWTLGLSFGLVATGLVVLLLGAVLGARTSL